LGVAETRLVRIENGSVEPFPADGAECASFNG
jgi:hypothetical protein